MNYKADSAGTRLNFQVLAEAVSQVRQSRPLASGWKARIDEDYQSRKG